MVLCARILQRIQEKGDVLNPAYSSQVLLQTRSPSKSVAFFLTTPGHFIEIRLVQTWQKTIFSGL
jgi:hypothetical protein